jgi:hypothetical protein
MFHSPISFALTSRRQRHSPTGAPQNKLACVHASWACDGRHDHQSEGPIIVTAITVTAITAITAITIVIAVAVARGTAQVVMGCRRNATHGLVHHIGTAHRTEHILGRLARLLAHGTDGVLIPGHARARCRKRFL